MCVLNDLSGANNAYSFEHHRIVACDKQSNFNITILAANLKNARVALGKE